MTLKKSFTMMGALCLITALSGTAMMASAADVKTTAAASAQKITLLGGKLAFTLQGYESQPAPGGAPGTLYVNRQQKRVMIVGEEAVPAVARGASDTDFLNGMKAIKDKQKQASPSYTVLSEKTEKVNGLDVYHIEATDSMGGKNVQQATLLAVANKKFTVIQVISGSKDKAGHEKAVNNILGK